jgi:hypothetical protein
VDRCLCDLSTGRISSAWLQCFIRCPSVMEGNGSPEEAMLLVYKALTGDINKICILFGRDIHHPVLVGIVSLAGEKLACW